MSFSIISGAYDPASRAVVVQRLPIDQAATIGNLIDGLENLGFAYFARIRGVKLEHTCPDCNRGGPVRYVELYRDSDGSLVLELES